MQKGKIWAAFTAVFLAGAIVGVTGTGIFIKMHFAPPPDREAFREEMTRRLTDRLRDRLDLTDQEMTPIHDAVAASLKQLQHIHNEMEPRTRAIIDQGIQRVKSHLSPAKQAKLDRMIEESRKREFSIFRLPPPPPPFP